MFCDYSYDGKHHRGVKGDRGYKKDQCRDCAKHILDWDCKPKKVTE